MENHFNMTEKSF